MESNGTETTVMYFGSTGLVCSVGLTAAAACAAMRASLSSFEELPAHDNDGQPAIGAKVPGLDPDLKGVPRLVELLALALVDSLGEQATLPLEQVPLLIGLPGPEQGGERWPEQVEGFVGQMERRLGWRFHPRLSRALPRGHTAGFEGLRVARELLQNAAVPGCLVCGVDSCIRGRPLWWLKKAGRLKTETNSNGVIPGEAAGVVYVQRQPPAGAGSKAQVLGLGFAHEKAGILTEEPLLGLGLTEAARAALAEANLQMHEMDFRLSDVTGEYYGFKEQALALGRIMRVRREEMPLWHCADSIGDTGAAAGVCELIRAAHAFTKGYAPGGRALCFTSSTPGARAAAVLGRIN